MSNIWVYEMRPIRPAGSPSCVATTLTLDLARKLFNQMLSYLLYVLAPLTPTILITFTDVYSVLGSKVQLKAKPAFSCLIHVSNM